MSALRIARGALVYAGLLVGIYYGMGWLFAQIASGAQ